jgi:hypothetical protein
MSRASQFLALLATTTVITSAAAAQAAPPAAPDIRVVTISSFRVPLGEDRQKVLDYMKKWMVEPARLNPNVLSYRIIQHFYGSNSSDVAIVAEYPNWAAIGADCAPCDKWFETNMPKENTAERKAVDDALALFQKYYSSHADQIYNANMAFAKR